MQQTTPQQTLRHVGLIIIGYAILTTVINFLPMNLAADRVLYSLYRVEYVAFLLPLLGLAFCGLLGFGIMRRNKIAYTIFNIVAFFALLSALFAVAGSLYALSLQVNDGINYVPGLVSSAITEIFFGCCLIKLHPKQVRAALR